MTSGVMTIICKKTWSIILWLLNLLRKILLIFVPRRFRRTSKPLLPVTSPQADLETSLPQQQHTYQTSQTNHQHLEPEVSWDRWDDGNVQSSVVTENENEPPPEPDFFQDMQPEVKKAPKIKLKPRVASDQHVMMTSSTLSNKFSVQDDIPLCDTYSSTPLELGTLDDEGAPGQHIQAPTPAAQWEEDATLSTTDIDAAIRESRAAERQRRQQQQEARRQQQEARRQQRAAVGGIRG